MNEIAEAPKPAAPVQYARSESMTVDVMIEKYLRLRDKKKSIEDEHKQQLAPYNEAMTVLEGWLLEVMNQAKLKSLPTDQGTAYQSTRTSAKVTDWAAVLTYIRQNEAWDLLEARVSKLAAEAIIEQTQLPIPGVETSSEICVNVRRPTAK